MGGTFSDLAAGTATPKAYELPGTTRDRDESVCRSAQRRGLKRSARPLDTRRRIPLVVFNPLNIAREDLVEASVNFLEECRQRACCRSRQQGSSGRRFEREGGVPSEGAIRRLRGLRRSAGAWSADQYRMKVSEDSLENQYLPGEAECDGDVASNFPINRYAGVLSAPARMDFL